MAVTERQARMALCALQPLGAPALAEMLLRFEAGEVWEAIRTRADESAWSLKSRIIDVDALEAATIATGARFLIPGDPEWPSRMEDLTHTRVSGMGGAPVGLWVRGTADLSQIGTSVALVGSRASTSYGSEVTTDLAADLATNGYTVVSGLAYGIDAAAHRGALAVRSATIAMVACGIERVYPPANERLHEAILRSGAVITEAPPGAHPMKASFLARNRLIAAASDGVVIVEAAARSGARNTASWAAELGRVLMAVPGSIASAQSVTPHWLIRESLATLVTGFADVAQLVGSLQPELEIPLRGEDNPLDKLAPGPRSVREAVGARETLGLAELSARTGLSIPVCMAATAELTESGWLEEVDFQQWALPRRGYNCQRT